MKNDHVLQALTLYVYLEKARLAKKNREFMELNIKIRHVLG